MKAINRYCPRSGKPVQSDALTAYREVLVGFCNTGCRDDFEEHSADRPDDKHYFDALLRGENSKENNINLSE